MASKYLTAPLPSPSMPGGIPYIIGNEAAERFSFYGMRAILTVFMTQYMVDASGQLDVLSNDEAKEYMAWFIAATYFFPAVGSLISDIFLGKYTTIIFGSIIYCLGHLALALGDTITHLMVGLTLIAIGAGGIKPCVSAHVGDQFGKTNSRLISRVYSWFYFSINLGSFISTMLTPVLLLKDGPRDILGIDMDGSPGLAFGVPGVLMFIATVVFWLGRNQFVHVPPGGTGFVKEVFSREGRLALLNLLPVGILVAMFWSLFDQTASAWVLQAEHMDRFLFKDISWLPQNVQDYELLSSQIQAANPALILLFIPLFSYVIYPAFNRFFPLTPLRKMSIGMLLTTIPFALCALLERQISAGQNPTIAWQLFAYMILTAAEVMVSITGLEFFYTQAPKKMKSFMSAFWLLSVSLGNVFTGLVNRFIRNEDGTSKLEGESYYWFFTVMMFISAVLFVVMAQFYRGKTILQEESPKEN